MAGKKKKDAKLASDNTKQKPKYKVTLIMEQYLKSSGAMGLRKRWIKEEIIMRMN